MQKEEWKELFINQSSNLNVNITESQIEQFVLYMRILQKWNENINLTTIIKDEDILQKHFIDCLTILPYINKKSNLIDVGTGAGFPGIPIKIVKQDIEVTLLDSLNKRVNFLQEVITNLNLSNIKTIHGRAEDSGKNPNLREKFDVAISRAVAPLNILVEYLMPLVKKGGQCICMKGNNIEEELKSSKKAIDILGGELEKVDEFYLPQSDIKRNIIVIRKIKDTPSKYPRKAGTPSKEPIK